MTRYQRHIVIYGAILALPFALFAAVFPITKQQLRQHGESVLHGFDIDGDVALYFAGDTVKLNQYLQSQSKGTYGARTVVLHVGEMVAQNPIIHKNDQASEKADWKSHITLIGAPPREITVHVNLGNNIQLKDLELPANFKAVSGGEIEKYLERINRRAK
ncbi:MAG: hypothetical protein V4719_30060 [Planctomycetota bacterium]